MFDKDFNNAANQGVLILLDKKIQQIRKEDIDNKDSSSSSEDLNNKDSSSSGDDLDNKASSSPRIFHKFSPLCAVRSSMPCPVCQHPYESVRGLKEHIRKCHGSEHIDSSLKEPVGSCKLPSKEDPDVECGIKITTAGANKHLKTHSEKIPPGKFLRGWKLQEDGKYATVFLRKDEEDPDCDYHIELQVDIESTEDVKLKKEETSFNSSFENQEDLILVETSTDHSPVILASGENSNDSSLLFHGYTSDHSPLLKKRNVSRKLELSKEDEADISDISKLSFNDHVIENEEEVVSEACSNSPSGNKDDPRESENGLSDAEEGSVEPEKDKSCSENSDLSEEQDYDSDFYPQDNEELTSTRMSRKKLRHLKRNEDQLTSIEKLPENKMVIDDFKEYITNRTVKTANKDSVLKKPLSYLFLRSDSLLKYEHSRDQSFSLLRNIQFLSDDFLAAKHPLNWIQTTDSPGLSYEMLKCHKIYREFLLYKLGVTDFGGSNEALMRKRNIQDGLQSIADLIKASNLYAQYEDLINRGRVEKENAKMIVDPDLAQKEVAAITNWNQSEDAKEEMKKFDLMYEEATKKKTIGVRKFASFGQFVKFNMAKGDKNRAGLYYSFKVKQYTARTPLWYPDNYADFGNLPTDWDIHSPNAEGKEPTHYNIRFSGGELRNKGQSVGSITITKQTFELAERYRDLKGYLNLPEKQEDFFFVNSKNQPLSDNSNVKGSIWSKCSEVTGVKTNSTMIRRAVETPIQENPEMCSQIKNLNNHGKAVGDKHYMKTRYAARTEFVNARAIAEGETAASPMKICNKDEALESKRRKRIEEDIAVSKAQAEATLEDRKKRNFVLSKKCRVLPDDKQFLQVLIDGSPHLEINVATRGKFPGIFFTHLNQNEYLKFKLFQRILSGRLSSTVSWMEPNWRTGIVTDLCR